MQRQTRVLSLRDSASYDSAVLFAVQLLTRPAVRSPVHRPPVPTIHCLPGEHGTSTLLGPTTKHVGIPCPPASAARAQEWQAAGGDRRPLRARKLRQGTWPHLFRQLQHLALRQQVTAALQPEQPSRTGCRASANNPGRWAHLTQPHSPSPAGPFSMQKRGAIQSQPICVTRSQPHLLQQVQQLVPDITRHAVQVRGAVRPVWSLDFDAPDDAVEKGRLVVHPPEVALGKALHCGHGVSWAEVCSRAAATQVLFQWRYRAPSVQSRAAWKVDTTNISAGASQVDAKDTLDALPCSQAAVQAATVPPRPAAAQKLKGPLHHCLHCLPAARMNKAGMPPAACSPFRASRMERDCTSSFSSLPSSTSSFRRACMWEMQGHSAPQALVRAHCCHQSARPSAKIATDQRESSLMLPMPGSLCV